jgi:hypothetical protein
VWGRVVRKELDLSEEYDLNVRGQLDKKKPRGGSITGLNLAAVKPTTVQESDYYFEMVKYVTA